ncbi:MAG: sugar phosphate isomerase/epimerase [Opitutaceae bacterium]|nr:sugar phosphate isomerase/epimerase [Opitutaceae bacterium]MBP9913043.1 sugar phosphate isomerase/epimerase [Opitutaceae bacterium]
MLREMAGLGFEYAELSHGIRIPLVPGILRAVEEGVIKIGSTHNFCPLPTGVNQAAPNLFEPSSRDFREHDQWLRYTKRTLDFAEQVRARVTVCHLGSVEFFWFNPVNKLEAYLETHPDAVATQDKVYQALLAKSLAKLRKRMGPFWAQTQRSIAEILDYAKAKHITLGFENRESFRELPLDDDYDGFLAGLPAGASAGYWHDTGHADIKQSMGLLEHRTHLAKMAPRLIGFHLHDVSPEGRDHQAIGDGKIDFKMVSEFWRPEHLLTIELSPRVDEDGVRRSKARVEELLR